MSCSEISYNRATSQRAVRGNVASGCDLPPPDFRGISGLDHRLTEPLSPANREHTNRGYRGYRSEQRLGASGRRHGGHFWVLGEARLGTFGGDSDGRAEGVAARVA